MTDLPTGWDIVWHDDETTEGFSLVNPEGETYFIYRVSHFMSPGRNDLLEMAESHLQEVYRRRSVIAEEANGFFKRARGGTERTDL